MKFWYIDIFVNVRVTIENFIASGFGIRNWLKFARLIGTLTSFSKLFLDIILLSSLRDIDKAEFFIDEF